MNKEEYLLREDDDSQNINQTNSESKEKVKVDEQNLNNRNELGHTIEKELLSIEVDYGRTLEEEQKIKDHRNTDEFQEGLKKIQPKKSEEQGLNQDKDVPQFKHRLEQEQKKEQIQIIKEDPELMHSLLKTKNKRLGNREMYLVNKGDIGNDANFIDDKEKLPELKKDKTKKLKSKEHKLQIIGAKDNYYLVKFDEVKILDDQLDIQTLYGYVEKKDVTDIAAYKEIKPTNQKKSKEGKILPNENDPPISHKDVYQAGIGDCYLHAALIALVSANPKFIMNLFEIKDKEVIVTFPEYKEGGNIFKPLKVSMSKKLFFKPDGNPLYSGKKEGYLWAAFLEKAWAIKDGSYSNISGGKPADVITMLTGEDADARPMFLLEDEWELYDKIVTALDDKQPITLGTSEWTDKKMLGLKRERPSKKNHSGLGIKHAYAVLSISNNKLEKKKEKELLKVTIELRDPRIKNGKTTKLSFKDIFGKEKNHIEGFSFGKKKISYSKE